MTWTEQTIHGQITVLEFKAARCLNRISFAPFNGEPLSRDIQATLSLKSFRLHYTLAELQVQVPISNNLNFVYRIERKTNKRTPTGQVIPMGRKPRRPLVVILQHRG